MPQNPVVPGTYPAQPLPPCNPAYPHAEAASYNQAYSPQTLYPAAAPEEFDETDEDDVPADGERGLGSMLLGRKKKKGVRRTLIGMVGNTLLGRPGHQSGYGYGYNGQGASLQGWYDGAGGFANQDYDMSVISGLADFDHSATIQQTMMNNAVLNSQMIANSGSAISNLC
jgi:hypothetical protein